MDVDRRKGQEIKAEETANRNEWNMNECILLYEFTVHDLVRYRFTLLELLSDYSQQSSSRVPVCHTVQTVIYLARNPHSLLT